MIYIIMTSIQTKRQIEKLERLRGLTNNSDAKERNKQIISLFKKNRKLLFRPTDNLLDWKKWNLDPENKQQKKQFSEVFSLLSKTTFGKNELKSYFYSLPVSKRNNIRSILGSKLDFNSYTKYKKYLKKPIRYSTLKKIPKSDVLHFLFNEAGKQFWSGFFQSPNNKQKEKCLQIYVLLKEKTSVGFFKRKSEVNAKVDYMKSILYPKLGEDFTKRLLTYILNNTLQKNIEKNKKAIINTVQVFEEKYNKINKSNISNENLKSQLNNIERIFDSFKITNRTTLNELNSIKSKLKDGIPDINVLATKIAAHKAVVQRNKNEQERKNKVQRNKNKEQRNKEQKFLATMQRVIQEKQKNKSLTNKYIVEYRRKLNNYPNSNEKTKILSLLKKEEAARKIQAKFRGGLNRKNNTTSNSNTNSSSETENPLFTNELNRLQLQVNQNANKNGAYIPPIYVPQ